MRGCGGSGKGDGVLMSLASYSRDGVQDVMAGCACNVFMTRLEHLSSQAEVKKMKEVIGLSHRIIDQQLKRTSEIIWSNALILYMSKPRSRKAK